MYDYPLAAPPPPPSPRSARKQQHRRSQSPLPHIATLLPTNNHHHQYSPSSRAADISRLLDPAYASSSSSSSMSPSPSPSAQPRAYVDQNGDLHDPDYRDFPVLRATARSPQSTKQRRTSASSAARSRSLERYSRPSWERDWATETANSDDEDDDDDVDSQSHFSPFASQHASPRKSASHSAFNFTTYSSSYYYVDAPSTSPPNSYDDEPSNALQLHESPFEDDAVEVIEESRKTACLIRKVSKPNKAPSPEPQTEKHLDESSHSLRSLDEDLQDVHDSTPTCTHLLRQQWQAMTLRIRFGVFHAKRRLQARRRRT